MKFSSVFYALAALYWFLQAHQFLTFCLAWLACSALIHCGLCIQWLVYVFVVGGLQFEVSNFAIAPKARPHLGVGIIVVYEVDLY